MAWLPSSFAAQVDVSLPQPEVVDLVDDDDDEPATTKVAATPASKRVKTELGANCTLGGSLARSPDARARNTELAASAPPSTGKRARSPTPKQPKKCGASCARHLSFLWYSCDAVLHCRSPKRKKDATPAKPTYPRPQYVLQVSAVVLVHRRRHV